MNSSRSPWVLELNSMASLGARGSYVHAAQAAGYTFDELVNQIVDVAHRRYFGAPAPRPRVVSRVRSGHAVDSQPQHVVQA